MKRWRGRAALRWTLVAALISVLIALPSVVDAWPTRPVTVSVAELLRKIQNFTNVGYSGYAQSTGGLALPVTTQFTDLVNLVGGTTQMRTWRRSSTDWRVDVVNAVGERDVIRDPDGLGLGLPGGHGRADRDGWAAGRCAVAGSR